MKRRDCRCGASSGRQGARCCTNTCGNVSARWDKSRDAGLYARAAFCRCKFVGDGGEGEGHAAVTEGVAHTKQSQTAGCELGRQHGVCVSSDECGVVMGRRGVGGRQLNTF